LDRDYKNERSIEHRAKFRADRPTELGDYARKKRKNHSKTEVLPKTIVFGRTNKDSKIKMGANVYNVGVNGVAVLHSKGQRSRFGFWQA